MANADQFIVTYFLKNGDSFDGPVSSTEPDIEKMELNDAIKLVTIRAPYPLEHELMPAVPTNAIAFTSCYFPNAKVRNYTDATDGMEEADLQLLRRYAIEAIQYSHRYISQDRTKRPEDLKYICLPDTKEVFVFHDNYAILKPLHANSQGHLWKKTNTSILNFDYGVSS